MTSSLISAWPEIFFQPFPLINIITLTLFIIYYHYIVFKIKGRRRRGQQRMAWLDSISDSMEMNQKTPADSEGHGSLVCCSPWGRRVEHNLETEQQQQAESDSLTAAHEAPVSTEFSRQEYWSVLPFPSPGDLPNPGIEPKSAVSPALLRGFFTTGPANWEAQFMNRYS